MSERIEGVLQEILYEAKDDESSDLLHDPYRLSGYILIG